MESLLLQTPQAEIDLTYLLNIFQQLKSPEDKIDYLLSTGDLISVRRGLYVLSPLYGKTVSSKVLASMICWPSYVSLQSALRYYRLIPEGVFNEVSVTLKRTKKFNTPFGIFEYHNSTVNEFLWGLRFAKIDEKRNVRMASPIKALYDLLRFSLNSTRKMTFEDLFEYTELLRLDVDEFKVTKTEYRELKSAYQANIRTFLIKWIETKNIEVSHARQY